MRLVRTQLRFVLAVAMLLSTAIFLRAGARNEVFPPRQPLSSFPLEMGSWRGADIAIDHEVRDVLGPGDFLLRVYQNTAVAQPYIDLFVAYFPTQRAGDTIHSPKNCLPGAGWSPIESRRTRLAIPGRAPFTVNRYVIAKGQDRQLVLYWYLAHDREVASEYWAKFYLVTDSMRMHRSDGSLIRLTTPLLRGETVDSAQKRLVSLASLMVPRMSEYIPR
jgi:EpsI family protein